MPEVSVSNFIIGIGTILSKPEHQKSYLFWPRYKTIVNELKAICNIATETVNRPGTGVPEQHAAAAKLVDKCIWAFVYFQSNNFIQIYNELNIVLTTYRTYLSNLLQQETSIVELRAQIRALGAERDGFLQRLAAADALAEDRLVAINTATQRYDDLNQRYNTATEEFATSRAYLRVTSGLLLAMGDAVNAVRPNVLRLIAETVGNDNAQNTAISILAGLPVAPPPPLEPEVGGPVPH